MARRLVEAGARCVTLGFGRWDCHGNNFGQCRERLPKLDQALSALVEDLHARGLDKDVSVVVWGEFGRTPKINKDGRPRPLAAASPAPCSPAAACGPARSSARPTGWARYAKDRPVTFQDVFATLYHNLGIDPDHHRPEPRGRPMYLLDELVAPNSSDRVEPAHGSEPT